MKGEDTGLILVEEILGESEKAIKVLYHDEEVWIPRSQMFGYDGTVGDKDIELEVSTWLLEEKGLI